MRVPVYKNQVTFNTPRAAGGRVAAPSAEQFDQGAQNVARLGAQLVQAGETWAQGEKTLHERQEAAQERRLKRESVERQSDILLGFERENNELLNGKLDGNGHTLTEGLLQRKLKNAEGVAGEYFTQGGQLISKYTAMAKTPEEAAFVRQTLARSFEDSYKRTIQHQANEERQSADRAAQAFYKSAEGMAGGISTSQDMRAHLDSVYKIADENGQGRGLSPEELKLTRYEQANNNVSAAVKGSIINGNLSAARQVLDGVKDDLLPDDYNQLNYTLKKAEEAHAKGGNGKLAEYGLYERAVRLMAQNPQDLQREVKAAKANMFAFGQRVAADFGETVSAKDLKNYLEWAQKTLDDPDGPIGRQKKFNFAASQTLYNSFEINDKDYSVGNKDLAKPAALAEETAHLRGQIADGAFTQQDEASAQKQLDNLRRALGTRIKDHAPSPWFNKTGDEFLQQAFSKMAEKEDDDTLSLEDLAGLYEDATALAKDNQLDLSAPYKGQEDTFNQILTTVKKRYAAAKLGVPVEVADAVVYNNRIMALAEGKQNVKKADYVAAVNSAVDAYKAGTWNGRRVKVKKQGDEIIDIFYED